MATRPLPPAPTKFLAPASFPAFPNGRYDVLPQRIRGLAPGRFLVEALADGTYIGIVKPGRLGPDDFRVVHVAANQRTELATPMHVELLEEFFVSSLVDRTGGAKLMREAFRVFGGAEVQVLQNIGGLRRSPELILKALKWIWAQEDSNFPISRGKQGRLMAGNRLHEVAVGVSLVEVFFRAEVKRSVPPPLPGVDYGRVRRALVGDEA